jgi:hypothetical protein
MTMKIGQFEQSKAASSSSTYNKIANGNEKIVRRRRFAADGAGSVRLIWLILRFGRTHARQMNLRLSYSGRFEYLEVEAHG